MGDIICRNCGEPWDAYGVVHAEDVTKAESKMILSGKGCPSCEGKPSNGQQFTYNYDFPQSLDNNTDGDVFDIIEENSQ